MTANRHPQRYEWEDAVLEAERRKMFPKGATNLCLRLATAINWSPRTGRDRPGLYWRNEDALEHVGSSRTTYYQHRDVLFGSGFFEDVNGNICPVIPSGFGTEEISDDAEESGNGTAESGNGTTQSGNRTSQSGIRHPFPVDTFPEDSSTEDSCPAGVAATARVQEVDEVAPARGGSAKPLGGFARLRRSTVTRLDH